MTTEMLSYSADAEAWAAFRSGRQDPSEGLISGIEAELARRYQSREPFDRLEEENPSYQFETRAFRRFARWIDLHGHRGDLVSELARYRAIYRSNDNHRDFDPAGEQTGILRELGVEDVLALDSTAVIKAVLSGQVFIPLGMVNEK